MCSACIQSRHPPPKQQEMPSKDLPRKRRKVSPVPASKADQSVSSATADNGLLLDQDAIKRHMLQLMQQRSEDNEENTADESDESNASSGSISGSEDEREDDKVINEIASPIKPFHPQNPSKHEPPSDDTKEDKEVATLKSQTTNLKSRITHTARTNPDLKPKIHLKTSFSELGIGPRLIAALGTISIKKPTEIQSACVEPIIAGKSSALYLSLYG